MFCRRISWFMCIFVVATKASNYTDSTSIAETEDEVTVYRLKINHPWKQYPGFYATGRTESLEEIVMAHEHERENLIAKTQHNFKLRVGPLPYEITQKDNCEKNDGSCPETCETKGCQTTCSNSCGRFSFGPTAGCTLISDCNIVYSGTSGDFIVDQNSCSWTIQAPDHHIIEVTLRISKHAKHERFAFVDSGNSYMKSPTGSAYAEIHDGNVTDASIIQKIDEEMQETVIKSSGPSLLIKSHRGWESQDYTLRVSYVTGQPYLYLDDSAGEILISFASLTTETECFAVTYSTQDNSPLKVSLYEGGGWEELTPEFSFEHHDGIWTRSFFRITSRNAFAFGYHSGRKLKFKFSGQCTRVYNLGRCLNLDYHAIESRKYLEHHPIGDTDVLGPVHRCRNGGKPNITTQSCICPQGFVGTHCEDGCGPNRYGKNCSKICSYLSTACERMLLCTEERCSCAPGFKGVNCDSPCESGYYGAYCLQRCGKCKNDEPCDRYTGMCYSGCSAGLYPPFCQRAYKVLMMGPDIIAVTYNSLKIRILLSHVTGEGEPILYEVQYKEEEEDVWSKLSPRAISNEAEVEIMGLLPGKVYETRVILIDKDGGSYQQEHVRKNKARTKCIDPHRAEYDFTVEEIGGNRVHVQWSYEHDKRSLLCEIVEFELIILCGEEYFKFRITEKEGYKILSDVMPDMSYSFQLIGKTVTGMKTPPIELTVHTQTSVPGRVRAVKATPLISGKEMNVSWQPPWNKQGESLRYKVTYECVYLLACEDSSCDIAPGETEVSETSVVLHNLRPHALYQIEISSVSDGDLTSEGYMISAITEHGVPHVAPSAAENPVLAVNSTSVLLSWEPPTDCSALNGYIYGYSYALVENDTEEVIQQGTVPENIQRVNVSGLKPRQCYDAHISVVTSVGVCLSDQLVIPFCTSSTAPGRVESLSTYKRGRRMVGLRWSPPVNEYGDIKHFTITYSTDSSNDSRKLIAKPKYCGAWVDLYCYTVSGLSPGKKYHFEVQARNTEVDVDGEPSTVDVITSEAASTPPVNLRVINATEGSMLVEWSMPDNINGRLRSFIIIVEQIDTQVNSYECCDEIPLQDYPVVSEEPFYQYEITGLSAASTYSVTVSAKTVTLGEESRIIGHTYPPKPRLPENALMIIKPEPSSYRSDVVTLQMQPAERINGVNRTYILLRLTNDSSTQQPFDGTELATLLSSKFTENYYLISEYTQEQLEKESVVSVNLNDPVLVSTETETQKYAFILLQEYMGNINMDIYITEDT